MPKSIRQNISCMCLWRNKSPEIQKEIAKECCAMIDPMSFIDFWNYATENSRHDFLFVDYEAQEPFNIRKNFNTLLSHYLNSWFNYFPQAITCTAAKRKILVGEQ